MIYVIETVGGPFVKIGYSKSEQGCYKRKGELQVGCPFPLRVRLTAEGGVTDESSLHRLLARYRTVGEWFLNAPIVEEVINGLEQGGVETVHARYKALLSDVGDISVGAINALHSRAKESVEAVLERREQFEREFRERYIAERREMERTTMERLLRLDVEPWRAEQSGGSEIYFLEDEAAEFAVHYDLSKESLNA